MFWDYVEDQNLDRSEHWRGGYNFVMMNYDGIILQCKSRIMIIYCNEILVDSEI